MLESDEEYTMLIKQYKLSKISFKCFRNFLKFQNVDDNFVYDILSKCLLQAHDNFIKVYDKELGIRNMYNMDSSVDNAYKKIINELSSVFKPKINPFICFLYAYSLLLASSLIWAIYQWTKR